MKSKGHLIIISGPSGVGKGTIREELMKVSGINLFYSVSMTTRDKRPGEENGREYYFVSKKQFQENIKKGNFLEYNEYCGNFYGTPKDKVELMLKDGKNVLLEIDVNGSRKVISKMKDAVSIFVIPPTFEELANRLKGRGTESDEVIASRIETARKELELKNEYKFVVVNNELPKVVDEIKEIINGL